MIARRLSFLLLIYLFNLLPAMAQEKNVQAPADARDNGAVQSTKNTHYAYVFLVKGLFSAADVERFNGEISKSPLVKSVFTDLQENTCKLEVTSSTIEEPLRALLFTAGNAIGRSLTVELINGPFIN